MTTLSLPHPFVVGITGGIASGKSTVAKEFEALDVHVIDADDVARDVTQSVLFQLVDHFGKNILTEDETLNRASLRKIIFTHNAEKLWLENLLHPLIYKNMQQQILQQKATYHIAVIPLLIESPPPFKIDRILVIDAPTTYQKLRLQKRAPDLSLDEIESIMNAQIDREKRLKYADDIIHNDDNLSTLKEQILKLHQQYRQLFTHKI